MNRGSWTMPEIRNYLILEKQGLTAAEIATALGRTIPMVNMVRRKLRTARRHGVEGPELVRLLLEGEQRIRTGPDRETEEDWPHNPRLGTRRKSRDDLPNLAPHLVLPTAVATGARGGVPLPEDAKSFIRRCFRDMELRLLEEIRSWYNGQEDYRRKEKEQDKDITFLKKAVSAQGHKRVYQKWGKTTLPAAGKAGTR